VRTSLKDTRDAANEGSKSARSIEQESHANRRSTCTATIHTIANAAALEIPKLSATSQLSFANIHPARDV
jgi:hypothetical protein